MKKLINTIVVVLLVTVSLFAEEIKANVIKERYTKYLRKQIDSYVEKLTKPYKDKINKDPNNHKHKNSLGILYAKIKKYGEAERIFQELAKYNDFKVKALVNIGNCKNAMGNDNKALKYYKTALKEDPNNQFIHINIAIINYKQGNYNKAKEYYTKAANKSKSIKEKYLYIAQAASHDAKASNGDNSIAPGKLEWNE